MASRSGAPSATSAWVCADAMVTRIAMSTAADSCCDRSETELRRLEDEVLAGLSVDERTQLRRLLAKALDAL
jgi:DNA-binding MarR family transcriptional regulator